MDIKKLETRLPKSIMDQIPDVMEKFKIDTPLRLSHFLAQCAHESGNFFVVYENLNYSAKALRAVFGKYFPDEATALAYERKPEKIANIVYASRGGNGDKASGEGWKYRGRGYIQLTLKDNYSAFDKVVPEDIVANPDLVATKYPMLSAAWFWNSKNLNTIADKGSSADVVTAISKKVNGGLNGIDDRQAKFKLFYSLLS